MQHVKQDGDEEIKAEQIRKKRNTGNLIMVNMYAVELMEDKKE